MAEETEEITSKCQVAAWHLYRLEAQSNFAHDGITSSGTTQWIDAMAGVPQYRKKFKILTNYYFH